MIVRVPIDHVPTTGRVIAVANLSQGKLQIAAVGAPLPIQLLRREVRVSIVCRRIRGALYRLFLIGLRRLGDSPRPQWLVRVVNLRTVDGGNRPDRRGRLSGRLPPDRKSTRLNSSHSQISYAVFCLKKKKKKKNRIRLATARGTERTLPRSVG